MDVIDELVPKSEDREVVRNILRVGVGIAVGLIAVALGGNAAAICKEGPEVVDAILELGGVKN